MSWEKVTEVVAPIEEQYKSLTEGLSEVQAKQAELDKKYTDLLKLIKNQVTVERLQLRDEMQAEMNHNLELIEYHKEAIRLYKNQVDNSTAINEIQAAVRTELAANTKRAEQHRKLETAFQAFIQAYQDTEAMEQELRKEVIESVDGFRKVVWKPNYLSLSFDTGVERTIESSAPAIYQNLKRSSSIANSAPVDFSAMPWLIRLANGDIDY